MKVIIAGSRGLNSIEVVEQVIRYSGYMITEIVSGAAKGIDNCGEEIARKWQQRLKVFPANWEAHGRAAGIIRNREMAHYADALIAIWDGESRGTKHMIEYMKKLNKPTFVYIMKGEDADRR